jgi:hypothetical protein
MNEDKLHEFLGKFVTDLGATVTAGSLVIGHRLGLYRALASGPATPEQLAERTGTTPRYIAEWLRGQAAGGYVTWDRDADRYSLSEEQAFVLADPDGAVYAPGAFVLALGALRAEGRIAEAFRSGDGMGWHEHDEDVFTGCEQFFRPGYIANLVPSWIPRSTEWKASCRPAGPSRTSVAASAPQPSSSRSTIGTRGSPDLTTTTGPSNWSASGPPTPESPSG